MSEVPGTRYAQSGEDLIAYQVFGDGDIDFLWVGPTGDCIDLRWDWAPYAKFLTWLGERARVMSFDRRGTGASDVPSGEPLPIFEQWADDALAVLDAAGSGRAVICGCVDSGPPAALFAASHPSRTRGLILANTSARIEYAPDYPIGMAGDPLSVANQFVKDSWGVKPLTGWNAFSEDPDFQHWTLRNQRLSMTPKEAARLFSYERSLDIRDALKMLRVPTLVLHREGLEQPFSVEHGRYLANHIEGAQLEIVPGYDSLIFTDPADDALRHIDAYLRGLTGGADTDRALAAILFTDIVGSTARASFLGDREWRNLLETHDAVARTMVEQHRGRLVKMTGDGMLATFDGPGRAIRCALALAESLRPLGVEIRAGLHTGEVELRGTDIAGIGVHIASRVMQAAAPGDLLVSPAVPMLVAGSGIAFDDRGEHELKGVPGTWKLYAVES